MDPVTYRGEDCITMQSMLLYHYTEKGGACIYYKDVLPITKKNDITDLKECLVTEIIVDNKKYFFHAFVAHHAKIAINLVISAKILVYFLTI